MNKLARAYALLGSALILSTSPSALAQGDSKPADQDAGTKAAQAQPPEIEFDDGPKKPAKPKEAEPPTPAHPHTELESGPPSQAQDDQWPVPPKKDQAQKVPALTSPIITPYASIVGGVTVEVPYQYQIGKQPPSNFANRVSTIMMSDFGVRGALLPWVSFESELMANGGVSLHGTSVFEGQASLQVRKQVIHLGKDWWTVEAGRIIDEASVDYFSYHVADTFLMDPATEPFLLFDGFNLGNGVRATAELVKGLRIAFNFNAGNVTSNSAIFAFGGSLGAYPNVFGDASASVQASATNYPNDQFQDYVFTPSILYKNKYFEAKTALQYFFINLDAVDGKQPTIHGYNARGSMAVHIADDLVMPFFNINYGQNDTVVPTNPSAISPNRYVAIGVGGGIDVNYQKKWGNYNGIGAEFVQDESEVGPNGIITRNRYYNFGTTYWIAPMVALGLRYAVYTNEELNQAPSTSPQPSTGDRMVLMTVRLVL